MRRTGNGVSNNIFHIMLDILFGWVAYLIAAICSHHFFDNSTSEYLLASVAFLIVYILSQNGHAAYNVTTFFYVDRFIKFITRSWMIAVIISFIFVFFVGNTSGDIFYIIYPICFYLMMFVSLIFVRFEQKKNTKTAIRVVFVGEKKHFSKVEHFLTRSNIRYNPVGYISYTPTEDKDYIGSIDSLYYLLHDYAVDHVYFLHRHDDPMDLQPYIDVCMRLGVTTNIILSAFNYTTAKSYVSSIGYYPMITMHTVDLSPFAQFVKRVGDVFFSCLGMLLVSPVFLITAILIKLDSPGPVFFKQTRIGRNGRPFKMIKFRSMCDNADSMKAQLMSQNENADDHMFKMKNDPRITKIGKFIRKTSIDELPQFINVIKGDMSLVGTRPPTVDEVRGYNIDHWRRLSIKPGITGMWQVSGRSQIIDFDEVVALDVQYIDNWSVWLDFKILLKTVWVVIARKGAS